VLGTLHAIRKYKAKFTLYNMIRDPMVFTSETVDISIFEIGA